MLAQSLMRRQDRLIACELEPQAAAALQQHLSGDVRAKAIAIDGWTALTAYVPPTERRGVVLIDPPFEQPGEFDRIVAGPRGGAPQMADRHATCSGTRSRSRPRSRAFIRSLGRRAIAKMLRAELILPSTGADTGLRGSGLIAVNPPWTLHDELKILLPALAEVLSRGAAGTATLDWLTGETAS